MKRSLIVPVMAIAILAIAPAYSFGQTSKKKATSTVKKAPVKAAATAAEIEEGKALLSKSDCMACHKLDVKLVGPAYINVAKKYTADESNYEILAHKIINGGNGVWGQVPMSPHPSLSMADAKKMAKYILSLH